MSRQLGPTAIITARKEHNCLACYWLTRASPRDDELEAEDLLKVKTALAERGKILPGTKYHKQTLIHEGSIETIRWRPEIGDICDKYELWGEE